MQVLVIVIQLTTAIVNTGTGEFEVGLGTVTDAATDTLSRDTIISSSNSDAAVNFSAGTKDVFCTLPAAKSVIKDASDNTNFADDEKIQLGTGNDIQLFHDGSNSYFDGGDVGALLYKRRFFRTRPFTTYRFCRWK